MKKVILATAALTLVSAFTPVAMADDLELNACTKDGKTVTMKVAVEGTLQGANIDAVIRSTFQTTAAGMDAKSIATRKGVNGFIDDVTMAVMTENLNGHKLIGGFEISGKMPVITGAACKVQPQ